MERLAKSLVTGCARTRLVSSWSQSPPIFTRTVIHQRSQPFSELLTVKAAAHDSSGWLSRHVQSRHICCGTALYAGHSKWQNIRHTKASNDLKKHKQSIQIVSKIKVAAKLGGGLDPKFNNQLARVLEEGKAKDIPKSTMDEVLRKLEKSKGDIGQTYYLEAKGIGNCMLIIEVLTDKLNRPKQILQSIAKKHAGAISESGSTQHCFDFKGVVLVPAQEDSTISEDQATELAIEAGAEEVEEALNDDGDKVLRFICDPKDAHVVKKNLEDLNIADAEVQFNYIPHVFASLDEKRLDIVGAMIDKMEAVDDVVRVYTNIEMS